MKGQISVPPEIASQVPPEEKVGVSSNPRTLLKIPFTNS
jgi:hypothetical protein